MTEHKPALGPNRRKPLIIRRVMPEPESILRIVVIFNSKGRIGPPHRVREADSKVTIKIKS
jgi:hypothetical protein